MLRKEDFLNPPIPHELKPLAEAIIKSRWMLDLPNDWDGEGSLPYEEAAWKRAVGHLLHSALLFHETGRGVCDTPKIHNGPEGSIDLHWATPDRYLLMNFPADTNEPPTFYGKGETEEIKGTLSLSKPNDWFLVWLSGGPCQTK